MADRSATRDRKTPWAPLVASAVIVPTVLAGLTLLWPRPHIESTLTTAGGQALAAAGLPGTVSFRGRDGTITGVPAGQAAAAVAAVEAATGVRVATVDGAAAAGAAQPSAANQPAAAAQPFGIARQGGSIVLTGTVGSDDEKSQIVQAATAQAGGKSVVDQLMVSPGATLPSGVDATSVSALTTALVGAPADLAASVASSGVTLTGAVPSDADKTAAAQAVTAALPGATVDNELTVTPGSGAAAGGATGSGDLDAAAKAALQAKLAALLAAAPITFGPDSPKLTAQGQATVTQVLTAVTGAPGARLQIDGFVAPGPGNGQLSAQQLSDARAATVKNALVAGGVAADHLTATGRGEGTSPGAGARRVVITVV